MKTNRRCSTDACYRLRNPGSEFCARCDPRTKDTAGKRCAAFSVRGANQCMRPARPTVDGVASVYCPVHQVARREPPTPPTARERFIAEAHERTARDLAALRRTIER